MFFSWLFFSYDLYEHNHHCFLEKKNVFLTHYKMGNYLIWKYISAHKGIQGQDTSRSLSLPPQLQTVPLQPVGAPAASLGLVELVSLAKAARALAWELRGLGWRRNLIGIVLFQWKKNLFQEIGFKYFFLNNFIWFSPYRTQKEATNKIN